MSPLSKALARLAQLDQVSRVIWVHALFERAERLPGANRLFARVASAVDKEQLDDYVAEVVYALVFVGLGFSVTIEPSGRRGPDLGVSRDGRHAIVEVTRFRRIYPGPPIFGASDGEETAELSQYGDPKRDIAKSFGKLRSKLSQVHGAPAIIAMWNDDGDLVEWEVGAAVAQLRSDAERRLLTLPDRLVFVVYASPWVRAGGHGRQLYCFPVSRLIEPCDTAWQLELEASTVTSLIVRALTNETQTSNFGIQPTAFGRG